MKYRTDPEKYKSSVEALKEKTKWEDAQQQEKPQQVSFVF